MKSTRTIWGIDVGRSALKAVELRAMNEGVEVCAFEIIEYAGVPSGPDADRLAPARDAIRLLLERRDLSGCHVAVSVPGRNSCSRFVHLAPIESGSLPRLVRYEAAQQIPFPIEEVIWRWQTFRDPDSLDSPDVDTGIFAAQRRDVGEMLLLFAEAGVNVDTVQTAPLALYNLMRFAGQLPDEGATLLVDLGADETDLVVADQRRIWTRTEQFGAVRFTEAVAQELDLPLDQAERLKRSVPEGDDVERIARAMEPVCRELTGLIRRCVDDYKQQHPKSRFVRLVAAGGGFGLPVLRALVEDELDIPLVRIDVCSGLALSPSVEASSFREGAASLAVACGLALQALGQTPVHVNFLPTGIAHKWAGAGRKSRRRLGQAIRSLLSRLKPRR